MDAQVIEAIRARFIKDPAFTPETAKKASAAAEGLCKWVHAMDKYEGVAKVVAPKQAKLAEAEAAYEEVMVGLRALQADLKELTDKLASMEAELASNTGALRAAALGVSSASQLCALHAPTTFVSELGRRGLRRRGSCTHWDVRAPMAQIEHTPAACREEGAP